MLIEFSVGNFRSFKDKVTLSMLAAPLRAKDKALDEANTIPVDTRLRLLTSAGIYGANASGKSNLVQAVAFMRNFVLNSAIPARTIPVDRFRLSSATENQPAFFEMVFIAEGVKYRYGFEVTPSEVVSEWLSYVPKVREVVLFERQGSDIQFSTRTFKEGRQLEERTRENVLFLSVVTQFNGPIAGTVSTWFEQLHVNLGINDQIDLVDAIERFQRIKDQQPVLKLIKDWDLGIEDLRTERVEAPWLSNGEAANMWGTGVDLSLSADAREPLRQTMAAMPQTQELPKDLAGIMAVHKKFNEDGGSSEPVVFDFVQQESAGTRRLFSLTVPILGALANGHALVVDEIDARLHPIITCSIIRLFNNKETNPRNAQLIFTTHDTNLLRNDLFRRDQIWFVEKDERGATDLYSLAEFRVRNDASFEENYLEGRYGAIPFVRSRPLVLAGSADAEE